MPFHSSNLSIHRTPIQRRRSRKGIIICPLAKFCAFSDMVIAIGIFLFGVGTLGNIKAAVSADSTDPNEKILQVTWDAVTVFACLLVAIWNFLCTMVLFIGVHGPSVVILRLWEASQSISIVYSVGVLWTKAYVLSNFHVGFAICLLVLKGLSLVTVEMFIRYLNLKLRNARRIITSKVHRV